MSPQEPAFPQDPTPATAEPVSRYATLHLVVPRTELEAVSEELFSLGALGVEERDQETLLKGPAGTDEKQVPGGSEVLLVGSLPGEDEARILRAHFAPRFPAEVVILEGDAWRDEWKKYFRATKLGDRLWIAPSWESVDPAPDEVVVRMDPGRAFGSGIHETTRLVLRELCRRVVAPIEVLDVGSGSGILSIAALKLGATEAHAVDVDSETFHVALENAERNGVAGRFHILGIELDDATARYPLVVANIQTAILVSMAPRLISMLSSSGVLVLSGILRDEVSQIEEAFAPLGAGSRSQEGEWAAVTFGATDDGVSR